MWFYYVVTLCLPCVFEKLDMFFLLKYYALVNRARGPYEEIFVLTFKAYGPNAVIMMKFY